VDLTFPRRKGPPRSAHVMFEQSDSRRTQNSGHHITKPCRVWYRQSCDRPHPTERSTSTRVTNPCVPRQSMRVTSNCTPRRTPAMELGCTLPGRCSWAIVERVAGTGWQTTQALYLRSTAGDIDGGPREKNRSAKNKAQPHCAFLNKIVGHPTLLDHAQHSSPHSIAA
jgi:hypothetical protein